MRAVVLRDGQLTVRETPDPVPGPGELLLRTLSTAICASDVHFMDHPEVVNDGTGRFVYDPDRDIVLGHEFVGEVVAHGPGCAGTFPVGTRVTAMPILLVNGGLTGTKVIGQHPEAPGSFGELLLVSEAMARAVPEGVSSDAAALVDAFAVGEFYVRSSRIVPGEIPIVIGAGAIGLSTVAALMARGIDPVIVSDRKPERLRLAADAFGAHLLVNPDERSPFDLWRQTAAARAVTTPAVVFECVGAPGIVQHIVDSCDMWTRVHAAGGWYTGDQLSCTTATHKGVTIQFGGGPHPEDWYGTLDAIIAGRLDPLPSVGEVIGLDDVPAALDRARRSEGPPRIVIHPNG
ncbi:zinc-binding dehydrogenase [Frankia sp. CNm7]|uniref:Zinc-binding dehydrogenase n=1 Tax=Frankia nepalensis TaxID=1836974 RepID=A0A937UN86_9ACTN|nr:zinc-binding dehydrogenase [Frankia nepalensis]MBL7497975.1 zinc-binding dehydrogenase [Frankia nepalensis]MBL7509056.1 zinc-binding dehydrogenase [Frankia nepalensis]MBL7516841.1 zinc-binding dehydrogenase [Frankia nepalensis]MBL7627838.1 zinc-binding dehydrogenase [Frankia nepalensis]